MPNVYIIAGPNGAGKTTFAREFLPNYAHCKNFVNADLIAQGLSPFHPEAAAFRAGRLMLDEIELLAARGLDFGFESTLSGKVHARLVDRLHYRGYFIHLYFLWIPTAELAIARVKRRVKSGGHGVDDATVRRRFPRSIQNFLNVYSKAVDSWKLFDNSGVEPNLVASADRQGVRIIDPTLYDRIFADE